MSLTLQLEMFSRLVYPGLDPFTLPQITTYLQQADHFSLALNKLKGKGVLYGLDHVRIRASFLNELAQGDRVSVVSQKLRHVGVFDDEALHRLVDAYDIGMGHSVYKLVFPDKTWVLKPREATNQLFYCDVLQRLGWPSFMAKSLETVQGKWELSEYLGSDVLGDLFQPGACLSGSVEKELAKHAALGDILGRGDRHFENYVVAQGHLYPIDLSYLFWEDNEVWVRRYISGGMAEFSSLGFFVNDPVVFCAKVTAFFDEYLETLLFLKSKQSVIEDAISAHFSHALDAGYKQFVSQRLDDLDGYFEQQKQMYTEALNTYLNRCRYKQFLSEMAAKTPEILDQYPTLKMYYLADKGRLSAFFLENVFSTEPVFEVLDDLRMRSNNL